MKETQFFQIKFQFYKNVSKFIEKMIPTNISVN
jgi:hypothetical protein